MDKTKCLAQIDQGWNAFQDAIRRLDVESFSVSGVVGEWTVKDIIAHVATWEEECLRHLPQILDGIRPAKYSQTYGGIDAFNALKTSESRGLSLADVQAWAITTHQRLISYLQTVPEDVFATHRAFLRRIKLDTINHYPEHTQAILTWRAAREGSPAA